MSPRLRPLLALAVSALAACGTVSSPDIDAQVPIDAPIDAVPTFAVTVVATGDGGGTVTSTPAGITCGSDCTENYPVGSTVTLTAVAAPGSTFVGWFGALCTGTGPCTVTDTTTVMASFALNNSLIVTTSGTGTGTVTSTPAGINCGADCSEQYATGTMVTLTATPDASSVFAGWSGAGCVGTAPCTVTINAATGINANFALRLYPLTVATAGNGGGTVSSSPAGIDCGATCSADFVHGTMITLSAAPAAGSVFTGWSGGGCSGTGPCTVTLTAATSVIATFSLQQFTLTVARAGSGTGTVTSTPAGINCGADCSEPYNFGQPVVLNATAASGSTFVGWSGGGCSGTGTCTTTIAAAVTITATFNVQTVGLTVARAGTGTGTVTSNPAGINCGADCTENYASGTVVVLTAAPATGSIFGGWSGGGCSGTGTCTTTITAATTVTATFTLQQFTLTVARAGTGSGSVTSSPAGINCGADCTEVYNFGTVVVLTATPVGASTFAGWSGGGCSGTGTCTTTIGAAVTITATFTQMTTVRIGHTTLFSESAMASPNFLLGEQIVVPQNYTLRQFGILAQGAGPNVVMALYTNNALNQPGTLVAQTASTPMINGTLEINPTVANVALPAGTYWIMGLYNGTGVFGYTNGAPMNTVAYMSLTFGSALPTTFPAPQTYTGQSFNYYLVVQ